MTTTGSGCAPAIDPTAASVIASKVANAMVCLGPNTNASVQAAACFLSHSNMPNKNSGSLPIAVSISVPDLAAVVGIVMGVATGVLLL